VHRYRRLVAGLAIAGTLFGVTGGTAFAHECFNISKNEQNPTAGAQIILDGDDNILWATNGMMARIDQGLIDPATGEGYHGIIAFDFTGDEVADASTFIVTPTGEIPLVAQESGSPDHGIVNICDAGLCGP
jgi:hypothetical protein